MLWKQYYKTFTINRIAIQKDNERETENFTRTQFR